MHKRKTYQGRDQSDNQRDDEEEHNLAPKIKQMKLNGDKKIKKQTEINKNGHSQKEKNLIKMDKKAVNNRSQGKSEKAEKQMETEVDTNMERMNQIDQILTLLCNGNKVKDLYNPNFLKKSLAQELFVKGIDPKLLTPHRLQGKFIETLTQDGLLVFYPSLTTSEIFQTIFNNSNRTFCLFSYRRIGKSFALALFVYLLRQKEDTRVLYIHNPTLFIYHPEFYLVNELWMAFSKEIEDLGFSQEKLLEIMAESRNSSPFSPFQSFLDKLFGKLNNMGTKVYIVFDEIDKILKIRSTHPITWITFNLLERSISGDYKVIMMSSAINEILGKGAEQEFHYIHIEWKDQLPQATEKYIQDKLSQILIKEEDRNRFKKIQDLTGGNFWSINKFADRYKSEYSLEENIQIFDSTHNLYIQQEISDFLDAEDINKEDRTRIREERKKSMAIILNSITDDIELTTAIPPKYYDGRHFIYLPVNKMKPLNPQIMLVYRQVFSNIDLLKSIIKEFELNASVLRFILETVVLTIHPKTDLRLKLDLVSMRTFKKAGHIDLTNYTQRYILNTETFELDEPGLYLPVIHNFAPYDAFLKDQNSIFALKFTKYFGESNIKDLICDSWKQDPTSPRFNTKLHVRKRLDQIGQKTKQSLNTLLVSVGQNPQTDNAFSVFKEMDKKESRYFFYLDATPILKTFGFNEDLLKIII